MPDLDIVARRLAAFHGLPWPIPALVIMRMTLEDLERLEAAADYDEYWSILSEVLCRIEREAA